MVRIRAKTETNTLCGKASGRVRTKIENTHLGRALVSIRAKIDKNTLFDKALVRLRAKIEEHTFSDWAVVRILAKIEKTPLLVGLWL